MNKKTEGNEAFKKGNFQEAVECYRQYTEQENADNKLAFSNMALCYHKMGQYQMAIQACDEAINLDQEFAKAYYRRIMARKQLCDTKNVNDGDKIYQIFQDCRSFVKLCNPTKEAKQIQQFKKMGQQYKNKLSNIHPQTPHPFFSNIVQVEKDVLQSSSVSWLEDRANRFTRKKQKNMPEQLNKLTQQRKKINNIFKDLGKSKKKDGQEIDNSLQQIMNIEKNKQKIKKQIILDKPFSEKEQCLEQKPDQNNEKQHQNFSKKADKKQQQSVEQSQNVEKRQKNEQINNQEVKNGQNNVQNEEKQKIYEVKTDIDEKKQVSSELPKLEKEQKNGGNIEEQYEERDEKVEQIYKRLFDFTNSRDILDDFIKFIFTVLRNKNIKNQKKQQILIYAKNKFNSLSLALKSTPRAVCSDLTQLLLEIGASQSTIDAYSKK